MKEVRRRGEGKRVKRVKAALNCARGQHRSGWRPEGRSRGQRRKSGRTAHWRQSGLVRWHFAFREPFRMCGARSLLS